MLLVWHETESLNQKSVVQVVPGISLIFDSTTFCAKSTSRASGSLVRWSICGRAGRLDSPNQTSAQSAQLSASLQRTLNGTRSGTMLTINSRTERVKIEAILLGSSSKSSSWICKIILAPLLDSANSS
eukprot:Gregarina_sp_Poly_1__6268@NODE_3326_length_1180_cov_123_722372_g496_i1_p1_GENE_NODE_3326_length_1180_cov_123_722372_g496_i1NODE_3326_length_1180_cov_123_722372_g496_i1_p1_ORF_typecomplete_len128_score5_29_NODE_3326_length_1180_cov_123_722372_g496_i1595978